MPAERPHLREVRTEALGAFTPDPANANRGTVRGGVLLRKSLDETGIGRSLVSDAQGRIVAGNKTLQQLLDLGVAEAIVVETDGRTPVIVRRRDFDLSDPDPDNRARRYAYLDNQAARVGVEFDPDVIREDLDRGVALEGTFTQAELDQLLDRIDVEPYHDPERPSGTSAGAPEAGSTSAPEQGGGSTAHDPGSLDFGDLDAELARLEGNQEVDIVITVPAKYADEVRQWLANGERTTAPGMGKGVLRRCGLL
jgi:hypothetical protein